MLQRLHLSGRRWKINKVQLIVCKKQLSANSSTLLNPAINFLPSLPKRANSRFCTFKTTGHFNWSQLSLLKAFFPYAQKQLPQSLFLLSFHYWFLLMSLSSEHGSVPRLNLINLLCLYSYFIQFHSFNYHPCTDDLFIALLGLYCEHLWRQTLDNSSISDLIKMDCSLIPHFQLLRYKH